MRHQGSNLDSAPRSACRKVVVHFPRLGFDCGATTNLKCAAPKNAKPENRPERQKSLFPSRALFGSFFQFAGVAAADDNVVGFQRLTELRDHICNDATPLFGPNRRRPRSPK